MADIDAEIQRRLQSASRAFGRLRERVFDVRDLSTKKMTLVYKAVILPTLLIYGSETWVTYQLTLLPTPPERPGEVPSTLPSTDSPH